VGARCLEACVAGAWANVLVNVVNLPAEDPRKVSLKTQAAQEMATAADQCKNVLKMVQQRMDAANS
jgi:formiminotetrahydrofolate cyclodeaminase